MSTCVVTGGAGFLGSHLCDYLLAKGHRVVCVDNLVTSSLQNLEHIRGDDFEFMNHDVIEPIEIDGPVDTVYHLAALASPIDYLRQPLHSLKVGSYGTHHALGLAKWKRARFLLASTSEVYGDPLVHPQPESYWGNVNPIGPRGVYDEAKRYGEALTMAYHSQQGVDTAIVRIFNTYGPRMRPHDGRAIPTFMRQALAGEPLTVFGDGSQTRSFCYVDDLIRGLYLLATSEEHLPVNIGNPDEFTLLELAHAVLKVTGSSSEIVYEALPVDDPQVRQPDITRARQVLGWEPELALEEGLRRMLQAVGQPIALLADPLLLEQLPVERVDVVDQARDGVALAHALSTRFTHLLPENGVGGQLGQALGEPLDVSHLDEEPVDAVADDVGHATDTRCDHGLARCERLDRADRRALVRGGKDERIERRVVRRDVVLVAEEEAVANDAEVVGELLESVAIRPVTDEAEDGVDPGVAQVLAREEDVLGSLHGRHAADPADDEAVGGDAEQTARALARSCRRIDTLLELDAQADDGELLGRCDAERDEVVAYLRADGHERGRRRGERALEEAEEASAHWVEIATENVAVEGVHRDRRFRVTREERGDPPDGAGLRGVRVQDVRPDVLDDRGQPPRSSEVVDRRDLAAEVRQRLDRDSTLLGHVRHRPLARRERARDKGRLVAPGSEALGQVRDMERRPAEVEPGYYAEYADRLRRRQGSRPSRGGRPRGRPAAPSRERRARRRCRPTTSECLRRVRGDTRARPRLRASRRRRRQARSRSPTAPSRC